MTEKVAAAAVVETLRDEVRASNSKLHHAQSFSAALQVGAAVPMLAPLFYHQEVVWSSGAGILPDSRGGQATKRELRPAG